MYSTKLSEVEIKEIMSDNEYVLGVAEDGEVVRTPKSTMGKVKTVNDIEPDENGNIKIDTGNPVLADVGDYVVNEEYFSTEFTGTSTIDPEYVGNPVVEMLCDLIGYEGTSVIVEFDGKKYECTSKATFDQNIYVQDSGYYVYRCLGNARLGDPENTYLEDTQEPFLFAIIGDYFNPMQKWCIIASDDGNHTFRITQDVTKTNPIPEKYLPDNGRVLIIDYPENNYSCLKLGGYTVDEMIAFINNGGVVKIRENLIATEYASLSSVFYEPVGFVKTTMGGDLSSIENGIIFTTTAPASISVSYDQDLYLYGSIGSPQTLTWAHGMLIKGDHIPESDEEI